jgi:hypothetical protein
MCEKRCSVGRQMCVLGGRRARGLRAVVHRQVSRGQDYINTNGKCLYFPWPRFTGGLLFVCDKTSSRCLLHVCTRRGGRADSRLAPPHLVSGGRSHRDGPHGRHSSFVRFVRSCVTCSESRCMRGARRDHGPRSVVLDPSRSCFFL